jgi:Short C-terminal domain
MAEHDQKDMQAQQDAFNAQVKAVAGTGATPADQLTKLADLHTKGLLTDEEFAAQKASILA